LIVFEFTESDRPERFSEPLRSSQAGRLRVRVGLRSRSCDVCAWPGSRRSCDCARRPPIARQPPANARAFRPFPWARLFILFYCNAAFFWWNVAGRGDLIKTMAEISPRKATKVGWARRLRARFTV